MHKALRFDSFVVTVLLDLLKYISFGTIFTANHIFLHASPKRSLRSSGVIATLFHT